MICAVAGLMLAAPRGRPAGAQGGPGDEGFTVRAVVPRYLVAGGEAVDAGAQVLSPGGVPAPDGTQVVFTANLGLTLDPVRAPTRGGVASTRLHPSVEAGFAQVDAAVGSARGQAVVWVRPGPAAAVTSLTAAPGAVEAHGSTMITARLADAFGNPADGDAVRWSATGGRLDAEAGFVERGVATVRFVAAGPGTARVTAAAGTAAAAVGIPVRPGRRPEALLLPRLMGRRVPHGCVNVLSALPVPGAGALDGRWGGWTAAPGDGGADIVAAPELGGGAVRLWSRAGRAPAQVSQTVDVLPGASGGSLRLWVRGAASGAARLRVEVWSTVQVGQTVTRAPLLVVPLETSRDWRLETLPLPVAPAATTRVVFSPRVDEGEAVADVGRPRLEVCWP